MCGVAGVYAKRKVEVDLSEMASIHGDECWLICVDCPWAKTLVKVVSSHQLSINKQPKRGSRMVNNDKTTMDVRDMRACSEFWMLGFWPKLPSASSFYSREACTSLPPQASLYARALKGCTHKIQCMSRL